MSRQHHRGAPASRPRLVGGRGLGPPGPAAVQLLADALAALDAVYRLIPEVQCKGLCADSCHNTTATAIEAARIVDAGGPVIGPPVPVPVLQRRAAALGSDQLYGDHTRCPALSALGTCTVYAVRPLMCRAFGAVDHHHMRCEHGCSPDHWLTFGQLLEMLIRVEVLSRAVTGRAVLPVPGD